MSGIFGGIANLAENIISGLKDLLISLFVPSDDFFSGKFSVLTDKLGWVGQIVTECKSFVSSLEMQTFAADPVIAFPVDYNFGGKNQHVDVVLDFSWYAPYRDMCNKIISIILWLLFYWRTLMAMPNIISGAGAAVDFGVDYLQYNSEDQRLSRQARSINNRRTVERYNKSQRGGKK